MKISKRKTKIAEEILDQWLSEQVISNEERVKLRNSIETIDFDWKRVAKYSFWFSIVCLITAVGAIVADKVLIELLQKLFNAPAIAKFVFFAILAAVFYFVGISRKRVKPARVYSNESFFILGVLSTAASIAFLGSAIDTGSGHFSILILFAAIIYLSLGLWFPSKLVWLFALLTLGGWFGAETGYVSGWGAYYLGMNYPMRFVLFGIVLTCGSYIFKMWVPRKDFFKMTRTMGLLNLFIALWIMSIFGNYGDIHSWYDIKQIELFHWSLVFGLFAVATLFHGIKFDDQISRGFGLTFLFINLYTRFFEHFWDSIHKAVFFVVLGMSFWLIGRYAEKIWNIEFVRARNKEFPQ